MADALWKDYSLTGVNAGSGFAPGEWHSTPVSRKRMKELMRRSDKTALVDYSLWLLLLVFSGGLMIYTWGAVWAIPATLFYGVIFASGAQSRRHECSHGTVFRTRWLNDFFHHLTTFMVWKNPYIWRWSHVRHHTDTIVVGRDPEIQFPRPPSIFEFIVNFFYLSASLAQFKIMVRLAFGHLTEDEKSFLVEMDRGKAYVTARIHLAVITGTLVWSVAIGSWLPAMMIVFPCIYGSWLHSLYNTTQHAGLAEDIPDHRLNSRTVIINRFFSFIYSNMNYHVEHHMYPMVPYYNLPALHEEIKHDCSKPYPSTLAAYREIIPALLRQRKNPLYYVKRPLPTAATPGPDYTRPFDTMPAVA